MRDILLCILFWGCVSCNSCSQIPDHEEFRTYVRDGDVDAVKEAINAGYDVANDYKDDLYGRTALHEGITHYDMIKLLLKSGVDVNRRTTLVGGLVTPLTSAARRADVDIPTMRLLLDAGADPLIMNYNGQTALDVTLMYSNEQKKELLRQAVRERSSSANANSSPQLIRDNRSIKAGEGIAFQNAATRWDPIVLVNGDPVLFADEYGIHDLCKWMVKGTNVVEFIARRTKYEPDDVEWFRIWRYDKQDSSIAQRLYAFEVLPATQHGYRYRCEIQFDDETEPVFPDCSPVGSALSAKDRMEIYGIIQDYAAIIRKKNVIADQEFLYLYRNGTLPQRLSSFNEFLSSYLYKENFSIPVVALEDLEFIKGSKIVAVVAREATKHILFADIDQSGKNSSPAAGKPVFVSDHLSFVKIDGVWELLF
ncbi:MAG: hypothetical protein JXR40_04210 [Pontiellaceae bacterium]|nr:hypothetical protein [Pontiellaceae bacterium]